MRKVTRFSTPTRLLSTRSRFHWGTGGKGARVGEISEDISEQVRLQDEIQKKLEFLGNILKYSPDGIIGNDQLGNIFLFNEGAERIFGYTAGEAGGSES